MTHSRSAPAGLAGCLLLLAAACNNGSDAVSVAPPPEPPAFVQPPTLVAVAAPTAPLATALKLETDRPTQVELAFDDGVRQWRTLVAEDFATRRDELSVLGMRPGRTHTIEVIVRDADGGEATAPQPLLFTTPDLPATFPPLEVTQSQPARMEPGVTLCNTMSLGAEIKSFLVVVDHQGEVVWYFDGAQSPITQNQTLFAHRAPNGNLLVVVGRLRLMEIDMLGRVQALWSANRLLQPPPPPGTVLLDTDTIHHDALVLPPGAGADLAILGSERRVLPNYPADEVDPTITSPSSEVIGDVIVEFDRDGTIVREIKLLDILDPYRMCYDSLGNYWNMFYQPNDTEDWSHANAIFYDARDDSYLMSLRHQDAVVKIDRTSGELVWILGDPARWQQPWAQKLLSPVGAQFEWQYHQHAPEITAQGTILLFDNGNHRAVPPTAGMPETAAYSRAVEFAVDEQNRTVEQVWAYGGAYDPGHAFYSFFVCDADQLPQTGNVLVTDGGKQTFTAPIHQYARIAEVTHTAPPEVVFELWIRDNGTAPRNWAVYRSERLADLYPR